MQVLVHLVVVRGTHLEQQAQATSRRNLVLALLYRIFFKLLFSILYLRAVSVASIILRNNLRFEYILTFMHAHVELLHGEVPVLMQGRYLGTFRRAVVQI